jgi:glycosyltransferase involved in cell wall biosynthesis
MFNAALARDYGLDRSRAMVLRHPTDLQRHRPKPRTAGPLRLLFVSRLAPRKGVELIVELSHRLDDLEGDIVIELIGGPSLWADYRPLLAGLDLRTAIYRGVIASDELQRDMGSADAVLVPSTFEPGSLVIGEALASGLPVIASEAVGPVEVLPPDICRTFASGSADHLEASVRQLVSELPARRDALAATARAAAREHFEPARIAHQLIQAINHQLPPREHAPRAA